MSLVRAAHASLVAVAFALASCTTRAPAPDAAEADTGILVDALDARQPTTALDVPTVDVADRVTPGDTPDAREASDAPEPSDGAPADASGDALALTLMPDFALPDVNAASASYGTAVSPRGQLGAVSAWYFGHST